MALKTIDAFLFRDEFSGGNRRCLHLWFSIRQQQFIHKVAGVPGFEPTAFMPSSFTLTFLLSGLRMDSGKRGKMPSALVYSDFLVKITKCTVTSVPVPVLSILS